MLTVLFVVCGFVVAIGLAWLFISATISVEMQRAIDRAQDDEPDDEDERGTV